MPQTMPGALVGQAAGDVAAQAGLRQLSDKYGRVREAAANSLVVAVLSPFLALASGFWKRLLLAVVVLDIPLQFGKHLYYSEEDAAVGALAGLSISVTTIAIAGLYASQVVQAITGRGSGERHRMEINLPLALFVGISALSLLAAQDVRLSFFEIFLNVQMYLLFLYVANFVRTRKEVLFLVSMLLVGAVLESAIIILLSFTGMPASIPSHIYMDPGSARGFMRIGGTLGSPNQTAGFLSILLALAASLLFTPLSSKYKWLARGVLSLGSVALVLTYSRGGWIALALALALLCFVLWRKRGLSLRAPILIALIMALAYAPFHGAISTRLFGDDRGSAESRIPLMKLAFRMIEDNPVLGVGSNNFQLVMYHYLTSEFRQGFRYAVHNKYLLVLAETGVVGFLAYLAFLFGILRKGWRTWKLSDPVLSPLALGFTVGLAGHLVHMTVEVFRGRPITQLVWLEAGLLAAMYRLCLRPRADQASPGVARQSQLRFSPAVRREREC